MEARGLEALLAMAPDGMWGQGLSMKKLRDIALELGLQTQAVFAAPVISFRALTIPSLRIAAATTM